MKNKRWGRCTYDVHTEGEGDEPKEDVVREVAWILYCKSEQNSDKGGGKAVQKPENFADVICTCPLGSKMGAETKNTHGSGRVGRGCGVFGWQKKEADIGG